MTQISFGQERPPEYGLGFESWLFHHEQHLAIQSEGAAWTNYYILDNKHKRVEGHFPILIKEQNAYSPFRATFGSLQCSAELSVKVVYDFLAYVILDLRTVGVRSLTIKTPPDSYHPYTAPIINTCLSNLGFEVQAEIGSTLSAGADFSRSINEYQRRRLKQAVSAGLQFEQIQLQALQENYEFIRACREERGYHLAIDFPTLKKTVNAFPGKFYLFRVTNDETVNAAAIIIDVGNGILYNFHSAHPRSMDSLSPVVMLIEGIHRFCSANSYSMLDLGTSAIDGIPNFGLLDFKLGLGGIPTMKFIFTKSL